MTTRSPANTLKALDPYWAAIQEAAARAERNLEELQPCSTRVAADEAVADDRRLRRCVNNLQHQLVELNKLLARYDYPVAGEYGDPRHGHTRQANLHAEPGCTSCGREDVMVWAPVHQSGLCKWCFDFKYTEGLLPTPALVLMHEQKVRMSRAVVDRELKPLREERQRLTSKQQSRRKVQA